MFANVNAIESSFALTIQESLASRQQRKILGVRPAKKPSPNHPCYATASPFNIKQHLVRSKLKQDNNSTPNETDPDINASRQGIQTCTGRCITCKHITNGTKTCTFTSNGRTYDIRQRLDCKSRNIIYMLQCKRCTAIFIFSC